MPRSRQHLNLDMACGGELDRLGERYGLTREVAPRQAHDDYTGMVRPLLGHVEPDERFRERIARAHELDRRNRVLREVTFTVQAQRDLDRGDAVKLKDVLTPAPPPKSRWEWILAGDVC